MIFWDQFFSHAFPRLSEGIFEFKFTTAAKNVQLHNSHNSRMTMRPRRLLPPSLNLGSSSVNLSLLGMTQGWMRMMEP